MRMLHNFICIVQSFIILGCCNFLFEQYLAVQIGNQVSYMDCMVTSSHVLYIYIFIMFLLLSYPVSIKVHPLGFLQIFSPIIMLFIYLLSAFFFFFFFFSEWVLFLGGEAEGHQIPAFLLQLEVRYLPSVS